MPAPAVVELWYGQPNPPCCNCMGRETPDAVAGIRQALSQQGLAVPIIKAIAVDQSVTRQALQRPMRGWQIGCCWIAPRGRAAISVARG
jgi:hypothetical protein